MSDEPNLKYNFDFQLTGNPKLAPITPQYIVGIDPGINGGIAWLTPVGDLVQACPLPKVAISKGRYELDLPGFIALLNTNPTIKCCAVEKPPYIPSNGGFATRSLAKGWGMVLGVLASRQLSIIEPDPRVWKASILKGTKKDKEAAIDYVRKRHPSFNLPFIKPNQYHDGVADAICLAEYARQIIVGVQPNATDGTNN